MSRGSDRDTGKHNERNFVNDAPATRPINPAARKAHRESENTKALAAAAAANEHSGRVQGQDGGQGQGGGRP